MCNNENKICHEKSNKEENMPSMHLPIYNNIFNPVVIIVVGRSNMSCFAGDLI